MCVALLSACQDENTFGPDYKPDKMGHMMKLDHADLSFAAAGGTQTIQVRAMGPHWKFDGIPAWLSLSSVTGLGDMAVTFTAQENASTSPREATLRFMADERDFSHSKDIKVTQEGATAYHTSAPTTPLTFAATPTGPQTIAVTSNEEWTATVSYPATTSAPGWCSVLPSTAFGSGTLTVTATENTATTARTSTVTITGKTSGDKTEVTVTQRGAEPYVSVSPTSLQYEHTPTDGQTVTVTCNEGWTAESNATWCKVENKTATAFTATAEQNQSFSVRTATITVTTTSGKTAAVTITQKGGTIGYEDYDEDEALRNDNAPAGVVAVDLGLPSGTKWANMNVGAEKPEDYGPFRPFRRICNPTAPNISICNAKRPPDRQDIMPVKQKSFGILCLFV